MSIRVGIVGVGEPKHGTSRGLLLMNVFGKLGARIVAAFDVNEAFGQRARDAAPECQVFTDWSKFRSAEMDAAVIASPMPFHAAQSIDCLKQGISVLSEVLAARTVEESRELVRAAAASKAIYMLGENQVYLDEVELVKRLADDGRFGEIYYAEGAYVRDARGLHRRPDGSLTWWGRGEDDVYLTHAMGPLLYILNDRVTQVSALANPRTLIDERLSGEMNFIMLMKTAKGRTIHLRADHASPRPALQGYYAIQGNHGAYEGPRGLGDAAKIATDDPPTALGSGGTRNWRPLADFAATYIPERLGLSPAARTGGLGGSEHLMVKEFIECVEQRRRLRIDVHVGLDYSLPGIMALESVRRGGEVVEVPDSRGW